MMLLLGFSDGDLEKIMPIALMVSVGISVVSLTILFLQWHSLKGNQGCVWLARRGVLINRVVFFIDGYGMETLAREILHEDGKIFLLIRYLVQVRRTVVEKELRVPVPAEQVEIVEKTVARWNR